MESRVEDIVIVGGGVAGLTTALGLHRLGVRCLVLESADTLRITGFALLTWTNAWKALDAIGIGHILRQEHLQLSGNVNASLANGQQISKTSFENVRGKHGVLEARCVRRKLMLEALINELPSGTVRFSSKMVAIEESGFTKLIHLADGTTIRTKVLVGCDGVNSIVSKWLGFKKAGFPGRSAIRGCFFSTSNHGLEPKFFLSFGKGMKIGVVPCDEKIVYWFFTWSPSKQEEEIEKDPARMKQYVLEKLENIPSDVRDFIERTDVDHFLSYPMRYRHPWELLFGNISKGNVCVAGDALHSMTPDLGQGGCTALEDGVILARCLGEAFKKKGDFEEEEEEYRRIEESLKKYGNERRWRSITVISTAYMLGYLQQSESKFISFFRDKVLATYLAGLLLKRADFDCGKLSSI